MADSQKWKCPECGFTYEAVGSEKAVAHYCGAKVNGPDGVLRSNKLVTLKPVPANG